MQVSDDQTRAATSGEMVPLPGGLVLTSRQAIDAELEAARRMGELQADLAAGRPVRAVPADAAVERLREALSSGSEFPSFDDLACDVQ